MANPLTGNSIPVKWGGGGGLIDILIRTCRVCRDSSALWTEWAELPNNEMEKR